MLAFYPLQIIFRVLVSFDFVSVKVSPILTIKKIVYII